MAIKIHNTKDVASHGIKCMVYGKAGIGKTKLASTAPNPFIISAESGLLSLKDYSFPYTIIANMKDIFEAYEHAINSDYETIYIDSLSEIAEVLLAEKMAETNNDGRRAYPEMDRALAKMIRAFRDIRGKNVVFTAKLSDLPDVNGVVRNKPLIPGKNSTLAMPYFFDELFFMTMMAGDDGQEYRVLRTETLFNVEAKDRSGSLKSVEEPNLQKVFDKIGNSKMEETNETTENTRSADEISDGAENSINGFSEDI